LGKDAHSVRWGTARRIALGWLITLPAAAIMAGLAELLAQVGPVGIAIDALVGVGVIIAIFVRSRSSRVSHEHVAPPINVSSSAHEPLLGAVEAVVLPKDARKLIKRNERSEK
jgi:PiT family inorganic phosphate transporter